MKRIYAFDFFRFFFAVCVVCYHLGQIGYHILPHGYLAVECFFIISGYLLANSYFKHSVEKEKNIVLFKNIFLARIKRLYPEYLLVLIITFSLYYLCLNLYTLEGLFYNLIMFGEMGLFRNTIDGAWFICALFWGTFIILSLMIKYKESFFLILCPLLFLSSVLLLYKTNRYSLMQAGDLVLPFISAGLLRAFAGLSVGCFLSYFLKKNQYENQKRMLFLFFFAFLFIFYMMTEIFPTSNVYNIYFFAGIFVYCCVVLNKLFKRIFDNSLCRYLGNISYMLYLTNILSLKLMDKYFPNSALSNHIYCFICVLVCIIFAIIIQHIFCLLKYYFNLSKEND